MKLTLKKNIVPAKDGEVDSNMEFMERLAKAGIRRGMKIANITIGLGFEAIIRYCDMPQLDSIEKRLTALRNYPLSIHTPHNHANPQSVDLTAEEGYKIAESVVDLAARCNIPLVVAHPNALRPALEVSAGEKKGKLLLLVENAKRLNEKHHAVRLAVENKPYSSIGDGCDHIIYSPLLATYSDMKVLMQKGIPLVFDTAHYIITRATIHQAFAEFKYGNPTNLSHIQKVIQPDEIGHMPDIPDALDSLDNIIAGIHLNSAAPHSKIDGLKVYSEGLVPERTGMVAFDDIVPYLRGRKKDISVVLEVYEADYKKCSNAMACFVEIVNQLRQ